MVVSGVIAVLHGIVDWSVDKPREDEEDKENEEGVGQ